MRRLTSTLLLAATLTAAAQKQIYIPEDLRGMDLQSDTSRWSLRRCMQTDDIIVLWERGFGSDPARPPRLEDQPMSFDAGQLTRRLQSFYNFYRDSLQFLLPGSNAERYKMMVMVNYSLEGTAYGGTYDNTIGALWVAPNRIQDTTMNCMAHELGHSFQLQIPADGAGEAWGGSPFYEMTSQWMLWQVNPHWLRDENYHFEAFRQLTHKAYLHPENIYHSPYVIQWWSDLRGRTAIARLYREGRRGEDPVITYKRLYALSQEQFCNEMFLGYQHLLNFDFRHARRETRPYACTFSSEVETLPDGWQQPVDMPEAYGFNAIRLDHLLQGGRQPRNVRLQIEGTCLRYGFVAVGADGHSTYSLINARKFRLPRHTAHLYLLVMGAPAEHQPLPGWGETETDIPTFPYRFQVRPNY